MKADSYLQPANGSRPVRIGLCFAAAVASVVFAVFLSYADDPEVKPTPTNTTTNSKTVNENKTNSTADADLRKKLTAEQYRVTCENGTEPPFNNKYWDNKKEGIYVDIISGKPLFASSDKFDSGTGWPSFTKPIETANVVEKSDKTLFMTRTEVRAKDSDAHLGHVFDDGPGPTGMRYCINSASLRFVPREQMEAEGYGKYLHLFTDKAKK